jgi:hypothetical protein
VAKAVACPECSRNAKAVGPYRLCVTLDCETLVVGGRVASTPWTRKALGPEGMAQLAAMLEPDMVLHVGAAAPGYWTARVHRVVPAEPWPLLFLSETHSARTPTEAARLALATAKAAA